MNWLKINVVPHLIALLVMLVATAITVPEVFEGKQIVHGDKLHSMASKRDVQALHRNTGKLSNWTDRSYCGMPATLIYPIYNSNLASTVVNNLEDWSHPQFAHLMLPMVSMYITLNIVGYGSWWSLLAALIFGLSTINIGNIDASHSTKVKAIATALPLLIGVYTIMKGKLVKGLLILAGFGALHLATNHLQITYYTMLIGALMFLVLSIKQIRQEPKEFIKRGAVITAALIIAILPNTSMLWSNYDYAQESVRGKHVLETNEDQQSGLNAEYANVFSHSWLELTSVIIPRILGGSDEERLGTSSHTYQYVQEKKINWLAKDKKGLSVPLFWGNKPLNEAPTYIGAAAFLLMLIALFMMKRNVTIMFCVILVFTGIVALGHHAGFLNDLMFDYIPFYNRFRAPSMILGLTAGIVAWSIPVGFQRVDTDKLLGALKSKRFKLVRGVLLATVLFVLTLAPSLYSLSWDYGLTKNRPGKDQQFEQMMVKAGNSEEIAAGFMDALRDDRARVIRLDAIRALVFMGLAAILLFLFIRDKISKAQLALLASFLIVIDLWSVNRSYLRSEDFTKNRSFVDVHPPSASDQSIAKLSSAYDRVVDLNTNTWIDGRPSYYHLNIGGNHAAKLRRYQDLIEHHLNDEVASIRTGNRGTSVPALNMLNLRFVKTGPNKKDYLQNLTAMGFAWFVDSIAYVETADKEIALIDSLDRAKFAIVHKEFKPLLTSIVNGVSEFSMIELRYKAPGKVVYKVAADKPRLLVMSEMIYKPNTYWKSYIDGKPVNHIRANYVLRAIPVEKGIHEITFEYNAIPFEKGEPISAAGSGLWLLTIIAGSIFSLIQKKH